MIHRATSLLGAGIEAEPLGVPIRLRTDRRDSYVPQGGRNHTERVAVHQVDERFLVPHNLLDAVETGFSGGVITGRGLREHEAVDLGFPGCSGRFLTWIPLMIARRA